VRPLCIIAGLVLIPVVLADEPQGTKKVIGPAEAIKLVKDQQVTVEFEIKSVGVSKEKEHWWLNSETDWKDGKNFSVFVPRSTVEAFKKNNITDPVKEFKGKSVQVTGYLSMHKTTTEVTLHELEHLKVKK
jgi:hypothetical protein